MDVDVIIQSNTATGCFARMCGDGRLSVVESSPAQQDSGMSNLAGPMKTTPAQRDSGISKLGVLGILRSLGIKAKNKTRSAQRDSGKSNLVGSAMRIMRIMGSMRKRHKTKKCSAQRDSIMSNLGMGLIGPMGTIGLMGQKTVIENSPAQVDSGISKLRAGPTGLLAVRLVPQSGDPYCPSAFKNAPAQPDSKRSNFGLGEHCPRKGRKTHTGGILTIKIKNIQGWFMGRWRNEPMSKMQNGPAQRDSIMSNLKIETENSLPQRYSKMSNLGFVEYGHSKRPKKEILTIEVKNISAKNLTLKPKWLNLISAQRYSKKSNLGVETENSPAQPSSGIYSLGMGLMVPMGLMRKHKSKNSPAQRDSGLSNLKTCPTGLLAVRLVPQSGDPCCPLVFKTSPAQRGSKMILIKEALEG